jgi:hypothetical protein
MSAGTAKGWVFDPHSGGTKIPEALKEQTKRRILAHAKKHYAERYYRLDIRFKGPLCYIDAFIEPPDSVALPPEEPTHLCRLRHVGRDRWSVAFFTYSHASATSLPSSRPGSRSARQRRGSTSERST